MPVIFDYTCSECGATEEYLTRNADTPPEECKACGSKTATFKKHLVGPVWIEGETPGSRPITKRSKVNSVGDLFKSGMKSDPQTTKSIMNKGR